MTNLEVHHFHIPQLHRKRSIRVLLPRNYDRSNASLRFPVLYMLDGQNLFDPKMAAFRDWQLPRILQKQPLYRQAIIVGIDNGGHHRADEYAPYRRGHRGGEGDAFVRFIIETLKPFIDGHYHTKPFREDTGIAGSSLGGLLAYYAGMRYAQYFGKTGVLSPSFWFNPAVMKLAQEPSEWRSRFYVAASKTEMRSMENTMHNCYWALRNGGYPDADIRVVLRDRGRHNEIFWSREFRHMFEWLF